MGKEKSIVEYGRMLHQEKLVIGQGGNISVLKGGNLIIKKQSVDMSSAGKSDYLAVKLDEAEKAPVELLSTETPFHVACYRARKDVKAVIHVHSPYTIAASAKIDELESVSYEFDCVIGGPVQVVPYIKPGSVDLAKAIAVNIRSGANAVLLRRHGAVSVGKDLEEAYLRILALERACIVFLHS